MSKNLAIAVAGAGGRLGGEICKAIQYVDDLDLAFGVIRLGGEKPNGFPAPVFENINETAPKFDVLIDVSTCDGVIQRLSETTKPMVIGVTGFSEEQVEKISRAAKKMPILLTGNFSLGVNLLLDLAEQAAQKLGSGWQIKIKETHHIHKQDYPSGTALMLAGAVNSGLDTDLLLEPYLHPEEANQTQENTLPIISYRQGEEIGQHTIVLSNGSEEIELGHRALKRKVFADGALSAVKWLAQQKPGFYGMKDVLGR
ncbi:MAG: 4-hydroxy-tetrahydrodipicolinate reductase [Robiginitomaculum sp.]|nr:4-hydroxy-tetrahydrodipicolinate reductase [Robiginitomaculum sp.]